MNGTTDAALAEAKAIVRAEIDADQFPNIERVANNLFSAIAKSVAECERDADFAHEQRALELAQLKATTLNELATALLSVATLYRAVRAEQLYSRLRRH